MGASSSVGVGPKVKTFRRMTVDDVAKLAEGRPKIIVETIRAQEIDGATLLELDEATIMTLASGLDQKKLLGGFHELQDELHPKKSIIVPEAEVPEQIEILHEDSTEKRDCQSAPNDSQKVVTSQQFYGYAKFARRQVLQGQKYDAGWRSLSLKEHDELTALVIAVRTVLKQIEDALASFLLDPNNCMSDAKYGQRPLLYQSQRRQERESVLSLVRDLQATHCKKLGQFVDTVVGTKYNQVPGIPTKLNITSTTTSKISNQPVESCFENFDVLHVITRDKWTEKVRITMERAAKLVAAPNFQSLAQDKLRVDPTDPMWLALRIDNRDGRTTALTWLYAEHLLVSDSFHATVSTALRPLLEQQSCLLVAAKLKSSQRSKAKTAVDGDYGTARPKPASRFLKDILRCSVVCQTHNDLSTAMELILKHFAAAGPIKDRRHETPIHDVLLHVFFSELVAEIQFHFAPVLQLKPFAHLPYEIGRLNTDNLTHLSAIFSFPSIHLEQAKRTDIFCKLAL